MPDAVIFDCEFLTTADAPMRFWCGPHDPDPIVVQIGAVKLSLEGDFAIAGTRRLHIKPVGRNGQPLPLDPFFTKLTGITEATLAEWGTSLEHALNAFEVFAGTARLWSWGKDELNLMAISCYVAGVAPPLHAAQFGNACDLLLAAGMPYDDLKQTRSNTLAAYFGLEFPALRAHDALDDALSVAHVLQHLLQAQRLDPAELDRNGG